MRNLLVAMLSALLAPCATAAPAEIYLVVNASNPVQALSRKDALNLFMGRTRGFAKADFAATYDLPRDHAVRDHFYQLLTGMSPPQVNSYWSRLMFTGQTLPPQTVASEDALAETVRRNPAAIGYLSQEPVDKGLRVVLVLRESP